MPEKILREKDITISAEAVLDSSGNMKQLDIRCPTKNTIIAKILHDGLHIYTQALDKKCPIKAGINGTIKVIESS